MWKVNINIFVAVCAFLMTLTGPAAAVTRYVNPGESIQAAIDAAANADEIEVAPGTYNEAINFNGKAVRLYSSSGPEVTTINGTGAYHVVQCVNGEGPSTILEGFTITSGNANGTEMKDMCGGGMDCENSNPTITNCMFRGNKAIERGGGMYDFQSSPTVTNCTFTNNSAYWDGGGMYNLQSHPIVTNCTFTGNSAQNGGGMYNWDNSNPTVTNCTFTNNSADYYGGGMENYPSSSPSVTNCTFTRNSADYCGGGMDNWDNSNPTVTNCILWGNTPDEIYDGSTSSTFVNYSDIQGGWPGTGNIDADPCFMDVDNPDPNLWNLPLKPDSHCIDAGDSTVLVTLMVVLDLDGNDRYFDFVAIPNTGSGPLEFVDMGAYEFQCSGIIGDSNCDGAVDFKDVAILCGNWLVGVEPEL